MKIMIIGVPDGEAPLKVRQQWVGLILPSLGKKTMAHYGVMTGDYKGTNECYCVPVMEALDALPTAARDWWLANRYPMNVFTFDASVCIEVPDNGNGNGNGAWG